MPECVTSGRSQRIRPILPSNRRKPEDSQVTEALHDTDPLLSSVQCYETANIHAAQISTQTAIYHLRGGNRQDRLLIYIVVVGRVDDHEMPEETDPLVGRRRDAVMHTVDGGLQVGIGSSHAERPDVEVSQGFWRWSESDGASGRLV
jgi:hypothetical protein